MPDPSLEKKKVSVKEVGVKGVLIHFWTYYKWWVIIPVLVIGIIFSLVSSYLKASRKAYLNIILVNARYESSDIVFADFAEHVGKELIIDSTYHAPTNDDSIDLSQEMIASMQKTISMITGGVVDVVITNARSITEYGQNGVRDLRTVLSADQIEQLREQDILYCIDFENEANVPVAINITGMERFEPAYNGNDEKHYLMLSAYSDKTEEEKLLLEYLFFNGQ